jgi:hypothetical protein
MQGNSKTTITITKRVEQSKNRTIMNKKNSKNEYATQTMQHRDAAAQFRSYMRRGGFNRENVDYLLYVINAKSPNR